MADQQWHGQVPPLNSESSDPHFTAGNLQTDFTAGNLQTDFTAGNFQTDFTAGNLQTDFTAGNLQPDPTAGNLQPDNQLLTADGFGAPMAITTQIPMNTIPGPEGLVDTTDLITGELKALAVKYKWDDPSRVRELEIILVNTRELLESARSNRRRTFYFCQALKTCKQEHQAQEIGMNHRNCIAWASQDSFMQHFSRFWHRFSKEHRDYAALVEDLERRVKALEWELQIRHHGLKLYNLVVDM
ncbi:hypothetical protein V8F20_011527 [Naviculisporaceae sp. PSN 640]